MSGNDGTVTRFGWKAQNKSLLVFAAEAYNVEQGVTNVAFMTEREENADCGYKASPEDADNDVPEFAAFMRFLSPPTPAMMASTSAASGGKLFKAIGCAFCHTPSLTTGNAYVEALRYKPVNLFSDLALHNMGEGLADEVAQGDAGPAEFRTAPLWGVGQRIFFLHDGRANNLLTAISAHSSSGSEANAVVGMFDALPPSQKQDILNFLRSL